MNIWTHLIGAVGFLSLCFIIHLCYANWHIIGAQGPVYYEMAISEHGDNLSVEEYLTENLAQMDS